MTTISATTSTTSVSLAELISGSSSVPQTAPAANANSDSTPAAGSADSFGAAAFVTLSEQAKQAAATKAVSDQAAADQLQTYVEAHHVSPANAASQESSLQSIFSGGAWPTSGQPQTPTSGDKVQTIVAQIQTLADANEPPPFQSFTPTKSLSNSVTFDGYTLSVDTNSLTQFYGTELSGNGTLIYDDHFGPSDGGSGGTSPPAGTEVTTQMVDNNEALDAVTITRNVASVSSASVSSSSGSASASSVNAQSSSVTFLVNYATGQISVQQASALSVSAQSKAVGAPGSTLSTLA